MSQYNGDGKKQSTPTDPLPFSISNCGSNPTSTPKLVPRPKSDADGRVSKSMSHEDENEKSGAQEEDNKNKQRSDGETAPPKAPDPF